MTLPLRHNSEIGPSMARVRIIGNHPHRGERGTVRDDKPMVQGMWHVDLDNAWVDACFAGPEHLRTIPRDEDPR